MKYRVSLKTTSSEIIDTLDQIAQLSIGVAPVHGDRNDSNEITKRKQQELSSIVKSLRNGKDKGCSTKHLTIPLSAISNAKDILSCNNMNNGHGSDNADDKSQLEQELEQNLKQSTTLFFSKNLASSSSSSSSSSTSAINSNNALSEEEKKAKIEYQKRIEKLKLNVEERKYMKLTRNIDTTPQDDATIKSMLYASSVGMNMIVAPISFGVLMYFFAGKLMMWIFSNADIDNNNKGQKEGKLNIHGVIVGVISGVIMLFIEMILFVIRNHEMDKHLTNKKKKNKTNPFGYNKKNAERTFHG